MAPADEEVEEEVELRFVEDEDDTGPKPWRVDTPAVFLDCDWEIEGEQAAVSEHALEVSLSMDFSIMAYVMRQPEEAESRILSSSGWMLAAGSKVRLATGSAMERSEPPEDGTAPPMESPGSEIVGVTSIDDGEWHHVAVVFKADGLAQLFVDGQFDGEDTVEVPEEESVGPTVLGEGETPHSRDFKVFFKALTPSQINGLMNSSQDLGTGLTLQMLPVQVDDYWKLKVAGLWGGALLTRPKSEACEHCEVADQRQDLVSRGSSAALSAALGVGGALPLAYLGFRRWRGGRWAFAAGCLTSSSLVLGICGLQLVQVAKAQEAAKAEGEGARELLQQTVAADPLQRQFQQEVLLDLFEDLMTYAKTICLTSRKTSVIVQILKQLLDMMHRKSETSRRFGETTSIYECFQEFKRMLVAHSHAAFATAKTLEKDAEGDPSLATLGVFRSADVRLLTEFVTGALFQQFLLYQCVLICPQDSVTSYTEVEVLQPLPPPDLKKGVSKQVAAKAKAGNAKRSAYVARSKETTSQPEVSPEVAEAETEGVSLESLSQLPKDLTIDEHHEETTKVAEATAKTSIRRHDKDLTQLPS